MIATSSASQSRKLSRRRFALVAGGGVLSSWAVAACQALGDGVATNDGRLTFRPTPRAGAAPAGPPLTSGRLGLDSRRDGVVHVPASPAAGPLPLFVFLHGAGGSGESVIKRLGSSLDTAKVVVVAPDSRDRTWDVVRGGFGPDIAFLDRVLGRVCDGLPIDPARIALGGFSDGASCALSVGLVNGDLFSHVVAFSPGFIVAGPPHGKPRVFVSHGTDDPILPINDTSRRIVPSLTKQGYDVTFRVFPGGHEVPEDVARDALAWMVS